MVLLLTASFTLAVDFSILNVALPRIGADVRFLPGTPAMDRHVVRAVRRWVHPAFRKGR